jgi:hypothetical protein
MLHGQAANYTGFGGGKCNRQPSTGVYNTVAFEVTFAPGALFG